MKKALLLIPVLALLFSLVACSKTTSQTSQTGTSTSLSTATELLVGTFKLEDTDLAVTADQAKQLLPLWQMLQSLSTSSTAATEEMQALVDQIKGVMTAEQMASITAMNLTQQDMLTLMTQNAPASNATGAASTPMALNGLPGSGAPSGGTMPSGGAAPSGGGAPAGGMPSGGAAPSGGFPSGGTDPGAAGGTTGMTTTPQAIRSNGMADQLTSPILNALIQLLQKKVQS